VKGLESSAQAFWSYVTSPKQVTWQSCVVITLALMVATGLRAACGPALAGQQPFTFYMPVVALAAIMGVSYGIGAIASALLLGNVLFYSGDEAARLASNLGFLWNAALIGLLCRFVGKLLHKQQDMSTRLDFSAAELDDFFENAVVGLHWVDSEGIIRRANKAELKMLGYRKDEYIGHHISEFHEDYNVVTSILERLASGEAIINAESVMRCKDGTRKTVLISSNAKISDGVFEHTRCFTKDITERKLEESRRVAIMETSLDAIISMDKYGRVVDFNPAAETMFGYRKEKVIGRVMCELIIPPRFRDRHNQALQAYLKEGKRNILGKRVEVTAMRADGSEFPVELAVNVLGAYNENPTFTAFIRDITERRRWDEHIKESEERYRRTFELSPIGIGNMDLSGHIIQANQALSDILGYTLEEFYQIHPSKFVPDGELPKYTKTYLKLLKGKIANAFCECQFIRKDGERIWCQFATSLVRDVDGNPKYFIGIIHDVNERRLALNELLAIKNTLEERVWERTQDLADANRNLRDFCFTVSHDLRAPLRNISGQHNIILEGCGDSLSPEVKTGLEAILRSAQRMNKMIDDIMNYARYGDAPLVPEEFDISWKVSHICQNIKEREPRRQFSFKIQPGLRCIGDRILLRAALDNLLENAVKYSNQREVTKIEFGVKTKDRNGEKVRAFFVRDNGCGFDVRYLNQIFEPFQRLHPDSEYTGTGLGLTNVRRIIERHNGEVWAESIPGQGTTFYFTLNMELLDKTVPDDLLDVVAHRHSHS